MNLVSTLLLSVSMSADAFAVAAGKGAGLRRPKPKEAFRVGAIFGLTEMLMPIIGYGLGLFASTYVARIDHWLSFIVLSALGARMIHESFRADPEVAKPRRHRLSQIVVAGIGSSIDALAVGVTLAFINADIWITAAAIGCTTFIMATLGMFTGRYAGKKLGKLAELLGGLLLIGIGSFILYQHLSGMESL